MLDKQQESFSHLHIDYKCSKNTFTDSSKSISTTVERILIMFLLHGATFIASYCTLSCWLPINVVNNNNCPWYIVKTSIIKWKYWSKIDSNKGMSINVVKAVVSLCFTLTVSKLEAKRDHKAAKCVISDESCGCPQANHLIICPWIKQKEGRI